MSATDRSPRNVFRVQTRSRTGYQGAVMHDVQLQVVSSGALVWAHTFTDADEAERCREEVEEDLADLTEEAFRRKWSVPSSA